MPSQRDTNRRASAGREHKRFREQSAEAENGGDRRDAGPVQERAWRRVGIPVPPVSAVSALTAAGGGSSLTAAIVTGHVQPGVVWPAVTLAIAGMAYDLACRALNRNRRA